MIRWSDAQERCGNSFVHPSLLSWRTVHGFYLSSSKKVLTYLPRAFSHNILWVTNDFTHADLVHADFSQTQKSAQAKEQL